MATAKKLPSGSWRIRVYSHTDAQGKKHYESFTAPTKQQAESMASRFSNNVDRFRVADITVQEAVEQYLVSNDGVLSPSTLRGYHTDAKRIASIGKIKIRKISSGDIQRWISELTGSGIAPKTVKNTYGLLLSVLRFSGVDTDFKVHLPSVPRVIRNAPEHDVIARLYDAATPKMKICISLAAGHSLRRGEISALKYGDLNGNELYIHADVVKGPDGTWYYKEVPKTDASNRIVYLSESDLELIGTGAPSKPIVGYVPSTIGGRFYDLCKSVGVKIRFHDLRVYFASSAAEIMPEFYVSNQGGWTEGSQALKKHYQKPIKSLYERHASNMNAFIDEKIKKYDTKYDTRNKKAAE